MRDRASCRPNLEALHPELLASIGHLSRRAGSEGGRRRALSLVRTRGFRFDAAIRSVRGPAAHSPIRVCGSQVRLINLLQDADLRDSELPFRVALFVRASAGALRQIVPRGDVVAVDAWSRPDWRRGGPGLPADRAAAG